MPSSQFGQISLIVSLVRSLNPQRMLEIGPGFGKYGFLAREYLELWSRKTDYERHDRQIDAIEIFAPYVTQQQRSIYDTIRIGDAVELVPHVGNYDLIVLIDVLEHTERHAGRRLIEVCLDKGTFVLVSTPKNPAAQEPHFGNIHERHLSAWTKEELSSLAPTLFLQEPQSLVALLSKSRERLAEKRPLTLFLNVYQNMPVVIRRLLSLRFASRPD